MSERVFYQESCTEFKLGSVQRGIRKNCTLKKTLHREKRIHK